VRVAFMLMYLLQPLYPLQATEVKKGFVK